MFSRQKMRLAGYCCAFFWRTLREGQVLESARDLREFAIRVVLARIVSNNWISAQLPAHDRRRTYLKRRLHSPVP